jgi:hypothetical protein
MAPIDRRVQLRRLDQDCSFELSQLPARLEAEVFAQPGASFLEHCQRVRLASRSVQGDHKLGVEPLPVGVEGNRALKLGNDLAVLAEDQPGVYQGLERGQAVGLQPARCDRRERRVAHVRERGTAPQRERIGEETRRGRRVALLVRRPTLSDKFTEVKGIDPIRRNVEPVTGPVGHQDAWLAL